MKQELLSLLASPQGDEIITQAVAELVSKRPYDLLAFDDELDGQQLKERLTDGECLLLNPACRFVRVGDDWYINGELTCFDDNQQALLANLVTGDALASDDVQAADLDTLAQWLNDKWLIVV